MNNVARLTISDKATSWRDSMAVVNRKNSNMEKTRASRRTGIRNPMQYSRLMVIGA